MNKVFSLTQSQNEISLHNKKEVLDKVSDKEQIESNNLSSQNNKNTLRNNLEKQNKNIENNDLS